MTKKCSATPHIALVGAEVAVTTVVRVVVAILWVEVDSSFLEGLELGGEQPEKLRHVCCCCRWWRRRRKVDQRWELNPFHIPGNANMCD